MLKATSHTSRTKHASTLTIVATLVALIVGAAPAHALARTTDQSAPRSVNSVDQAVRLALVEQRVVDEIRREGISRAIVSVTDSTAAARLAQRLARHSEGQAGVARTYDNLDAVVVEIRSEATLLAFARDPRVERVSANELVEASASESLRLIRQPQVASSGYRGEGIYVGVLDTGVNYSSYASYFPAGSIAATREIAPNDGYLDDGGHGTHVASTVLLVAPKAKLFVADVFHWQRAADGKIKNLASSENILAGVDWIIGLKNQGYKVKAVNLSLGGGHYGSTCSDGYHFRAAHEAGIIPVVAAGNSAYEDDAGRATTVYQPGIAHPACSAYALSVGAVTDGSTGCDAADSADRVAYFSQSSQELDLLAPGACITAAGGTFQGTSMAAPHVAGAVAILAAAKPSASVNEIRTALFSTGPAITDSRSGITRNRLDVNAALNKLLGSSTSPVDTTAPVVQTPGAAVTAGATLRADGLIHTTFSWSATDASGIARYAAKISTNGAAWADVTLASLTSTSVAFQLTPGNNYRLAVSARDGAGNWSGWSTSNTFTVGRYGENHAAVSYTTGWEQRSWADALGGTLNVSGTSGAYACIRFNGRNVAWIGTRATNRGEATVWLDGTQVAKLDLYRDTTSPRTVLFSQQVSASVTHDLCVQVVGTSGRPTIDVDAFAVLY